MDEDTTELCYLVNPASKEVIDKSIALLRDIDKYNKPRYNDDISGAKEAARQRGAASKLVETQFLEVNTRWSKQTYFVRATKDACRTLSRMCCRLDSVFNASYFRICQRTNLWDDVKTLDELVEILELDYKKFKSSEQKKYVIKRSN